MTRKLAVWAALWLVFAAATPAKASAILTITEGASGVVVSGGGSFDLSDLTKFGFGDSAAGLAPSRGHVLVGPVVGGGETDFYAGLSAPSNFGPGSSEFLPTLGAGNRFGIFVFQGVATTLAVPSGYVSGSPLIGINLYTFPSTFASLGVTPGTYVYSWGSGAHADSLTLQIGSATVVPEPASLTLLGFGLVALGARRWQQRRNP